MFSSSPSVSPCHHGVFVLLQSNLSTGLIPIVVWLKGPVLVQAQILGLLISQFCKMCVKCRKMQAGHILIWEARETKNMLTFTILLCWIIHSNEEKGEVACWLRDFMSPCVCSFHCIVFYLLLWPHLLSSPHLF